VTFLPLPSLLTSPLRLSLSPCESLPLDSRVAVVAAFSFLYLTARANSSPSTMARRPSLESAKSFEFLSPQSGSHISGFSSSDDDEIVWSVSSLSLSDRALSSPRSEDYVVLSPPSVISSHAADMQSFIEDDLISNPSILSQPPTPQPYSPPPSRKSRRKRNCNPQGQQHLTRGQASPRSPSKPSDGKAPASPQSPKRRRKRSDKYNDPSTPRAKCQSLIAAPPVPSFPAKGLGARSVVDDVSERGDDSDSVCGDRRSELSSAVYDKAVHYINCFLSSPLDHKAANLALLQALIIELGFFNPSNGTDCESDSGRSTPSFDISDIPQSMRAAKSFIKSHVFLNVRDYLALRAQGQEALQNVLHPSRKSLVTELRKKDARVPRDWVKQRGLNVLLVTCL